MKFSTMRPPRLFLPWYQVLWGVLLIALCVKNFLKPLSHSVFGVYYHAGLHWWQDESLYRTYHGYDYFRYSPLAAIFFSLFTVFGVTLGSILWNLASNAIYLAGCNAFWKTIPQEDRQEKNNTFFLICLFGALSGVWNSQCNITVVGLLLLGLSDLMKSRDNRACLWLALALFLKVTIAPIILLIMLLRPATLARRMAPFILLGFLLPFLTRPSAMVIFQYQEWFEHLLTSRLDRWPGFRDGWYLWQTLLQQCCRRPLSPDFWKEPVATWYQFLQIIGGLLTAWVAFLWKLWGMKPWDWVVRSTALGICWMMILGPAIEFPSYGLMAPFLGWACSRGKAPGRMLLRTGAFFILVLGWKEFQAPVYKMLPLIQGALPMGSILFTVWLWRDGFFLLKGEKSNEVFTKTV